jgi:hypothetical protein
MACEEKAFEAVNVVPGVTNPVRYYPDTKILLLGEPLVIDGSNVNDFTF